MTIEDVVRLLESVNSVWAVLALFLVGTFLLIWKYGHEILKLSRDSNAKARSAAVAAEKIREDIITNHGSDNLGDSIDRLTGWVSKLLKEQRKSAADRKQLNITVHELQEGLEEVRGLLLDQMLPAEEDEQSEYSVMPVEEKDHLCRP